MTSDRRFAEVIGDPIRHSKSPLIHRFWLDRRGIEADYRSTQVPREELAAFVAGRRRDSAWQGCNVTMPLKLDALLLADERSEAAVQAGACNILLPRNGGLHAANTDIGAVMLVLKVLTVGRPSATVTVLGTGGAARAVLVALARLGIRDIIVQGRSSSEARKLVQLFDLRRPPRPFGSEVRTDGLINATPLGMSGNPALEVDISSMANDGWVFDLVSSPPNTALVSEARARGLAAAGGLTMLVEQAAASFALFFGVEPPRDPATDAELFRRLEA